jgi:hypothetical protein
MRTYKVCIDYRLCLQFIIKEKFLAVLINVIKALYTGCIREVQISRFCSFLLFQQWVLKLWLTIIEEPQTSSTRERKVLKDMWNKVVCMYTHTHTHTLLAGLSVRFAIEIAENMTSGEETFWLSDFGKVLHKFTYYLRGHRTTKSEYTELWSCRFS